MPLATDPSQTYKFIFPCDLGKPPDAQPFVLLHFLSIREWREFCAGMTKADLEGMDNDAVIDRLCGKLKAVVDSWKGMRAADGSEIAYPPESFQQGIESFCGIDDLWQLYFAGRRQGELAEEDVKNSPSPSPSAGAGSAEPATAGSTSASNAERPSANP